MLPELLSQNQARSQPDSSRSGHRQRYCRRGLRHAQVPRFHRRTRCCRHHSTPQERETLEGRHRRCSCAQLGTAGIAIPWSRALATMERLSPPEPCRYENALFETAGSAPHGAGLRPSGRGVPDEGGRPERLHRTRHPCHEDRGIGLSGKRGAPAVNRFVQQGRKDRQRKRRSHALSKC